MKYLYSLLFLVLLFSCENNDYLIDGGKSSPYLEKSTYDFLKSNPLFDTLVMAINKAGLKSELDKEVTFFAVTNFTFTNYINEMTALGKKVYNDSKYQYKFDSIPEKVLKDSLLMYIFPDKITRENLTKDGQITINLAGTKLRISLQPEEMFTEELKKSPEFVFLTYKRGESWDAWDAKNLDGAEQDTKERIQTSGLISTTGIIHVMPNTHILFFKKQS